MSALPQSGPGGLVAVSCHGVSKRYALFDRGTAWRFALGLPTSEGHYQALRDVSFDVPKGKFKGILGRNGAGKSTLLRVLGQIYNPDEGAVRIDGSLSAIYELGTAGNNQLSGRDYADRLLTVQGYRDVERRRIIDDVREFSELGARFEDPIFSYSAGMSARLFFATATAAEFDVYLIDEVLAVGDQHFQAKCWRRLRERLSRGASGVLVTHDWSAMLKICETACILDNGRIVFDGPVSMAVRRYLYGDSATQTYTSGIARLLDRPASRLTVQQGEDLELAFEVLIERPSDVKVLAVVERLQPGFGWETALMSRHASTLPVGVGRRRIHLKIPVTPLEVGSYQLTVQLVTPDPELPRRFLLLDGWSWLDGTGIPIEVLGDRIEGGCLPLTWNVETGLPQ